jgi:hypothetical protein
MGEYGPEVIGRNERGEIRADGGDHSDEATSDPAERIGLSVTELKTNR